MDCIRSSERAVWPEAWVALHSKPHKRQQIYASIRKEPEGPIYWRCTSPWIPVQQEGIGRPGVWGYRRKAKAPADCQGL